jgi:2-oxoglutarate ferredoxin oxidoreductase subunit alpha
VHTLQAEGKSVSHCPLRYLNPFPINLGEILRQFDHVLIPELNMGQLRTVIRAEYLLDAIGLNKMQGKPFSVGEIVSKIQELLKA